MTILRTDRLVLRPLRTDDADAVAEAVSDWEVARWVSSVPHPYSRSDAVMWIVFSDDDGRWGIKQDGRLVGAITTGAQLGYWLRRDAWGRGIMTEAGKAVAAEWFADPEMDALRSSYYLGNDGSRRVLEKLGFVDDGPVRIASAALGREVDGRAMVLTRRAWAGQIR